MSSKPRQTEEDRIKAQAAAAKDGELALKVVEAARKAAKEGAADPKGAERALAIVGRILYVVKTRTPRRVADGTPAPKATGTNG